MRAMTVFTNPAFSVLVAPSQTFYATRLEARTALQTLCQVTAPPVCLLHCARNQHDTGYQTVPQAQFDKPVKADGIVLRRKPAAIVLQTADCPTLILFDPESGTLIAAHAGRPALTPRSDCVGCTANIVDYALAELPSTHNRAQLQAYLVAGICGHCFRHDEDGAEEHIAPFDRFGAHVFVDRAKGKLDMVAVITQTLLHHGMKEEHIFHDGICTRESPAHSSKRGRKIGSNSIFVIRH